ADCPLEAEATTPPLLVRSEAGQPTLARVTCPTSPRFWRWRRLPFPRLVPRQPAAPDEAEQHPDEWKWQLAPAGLCAGAGLAGTGRAARGAQPAAGRPAALRHRRRQRLGRRGLRR
ncbi:MAG TPA: hypothetical protein PKE47_09845, partial [Verrucomicrobiota bacterium]|nr:hypothetical protein [Verrucomicrobiota bacterium]